MNCVNFIFLNLSIPQILSSTYNLITLITEWLMLLEHPSISILLTICRILLLLLLCCLHLCKLNHLLFLFQLLLSFLCHLKINFFLNFSQSLSDTIQISNFVTSIPWVSLNIFYWYTIITVIAKHLIDKIFEFITKCIFRLSILSFWNPCCMSSPIFCIFIMEITIQRIS